MSCYALESKLLADRLNGRKTDKTELARYADKMVAYATGEEIEIIDSNGQVIFSNLKGDAPVLRQNSYSVEKNENGYFNCFNEFVRNGIKHYHAIRYFVCVCRKKTPIHCIFAD